ncbi:MAG: class I SAM-dependent methyltransferase [Gammaproteobacteria bacterium]|nr:class I SAM-dependent methyltransferase [Gammaproteobacteria bacterium]
MSDPAELAMDWNTYWRGSSGGAAYASEGVDHPLVREFWRRVLTENRQTGAKPRLLDVASGNGAVVEIVQQVYGEDDIDITCLDSSDWAIKSLVERFPSVEGVVSDARNMPFPDQSFDVATSQFGVEYAGVGAVDEMARLIAPGGTLIFLMHIRDGMIDRECVANFNAIKELNKIEFVRNAKHMFLEARKCVRGESPDNSRKDYDEAVQVMLTVFDQLKSTMMTFGENAAGGTLSTLYYEVDRIHNRIMHHDLDEVLAWLDTMAAELVAYSGRMRSMSDSAISESGFDDIVRRLRESNFNVSTSERLQNNESTPPVAWMLVATRK